MADGLTEDQEFRLLDLWTAPVDAVPKRHSTMCGYIYHELWDLWEMGLIDRIGLSSIRLTPEAQEVLGLS